MSIRRSRHLKFLKKLLRPFVYGSVTECYLAHWAKSIYFRNLNFGLDSSSNCYVYALLDPRRRGKYKYILTGGTVIEFPGEPFYIGMSTGGSTFGRMESHNVSVRNPRVITLVSSRIFTLNYYGLGAVNFVVRKKLPKSYAQALESELIRTIGCTKYDTGPLLNKSLGASLPKDVEDLLSKITLIHKSLVLKL